MSVTDKLYNTLDCGYILNFIYDMAPSIGFLYIYKLL